MKSFLKYAMDNAPLNELALSWRISPGQAALRLRRLPFVHLTPATPERRGPGRPPRHLFIDHEWRFWDHAGPQPLAQLVGYLQSLHFFGESFALGLPFTSMYWQPFLHPEVRLFAPPDTFSHWHRLFDGGKGSLRLVVELLPQAAGINVLEALPVLDRPFAIVDALLALERVRSANVLALADRLVHTTTDLEPALPFARSRGLEWDITFLSDHRRRARARVLSSRDVRLAYETEEANSAIPTVTRFVELLARERMLT